MSDNDLRYLITPLAGIVLPGGQALITGGIAAAAAVSISYLVDIRNPWAAGGLIGALAGGLAWANGLSWWRSAITPLQPDPAPAGVSMETLRVELVQNVDTPYLWVDFLDLPIGRETMQAAAIDLQAKSYNTSNLGGRGKALTRSQAEALRDYLIAKGLAYWKRPGSPTVGWELLEAGRALVRKYADLPALSGSMRLDSGLRVPGMQTHTNAQRKG